MKRFQITFKGQVYELDVEEVNAVNTTGTPVGYSVPAVTAQSAALVTATASKAASSGGTGSKTVQAPMPGKIMAIQIKEGDTVKRGDVIFILEAMKMQNEIMAAQDGTIAGIGVTVGQTVSTGEVLAKFS